MTCHVEKDSSPTQETQEIDDPHSKVVLTRKTFRLNRITLCLRTNTHSLRNGDQSRNISPPQEALNPPPHNLKRTDGDVSLEVPR